MWGVIWGIVAASVGIGLLIGIIIIVPSTIFVLPYLAWLGWNQGTKNIPRKQPSASLPGGKYLCHTVKNAAKLYRSWITHTPHNITDW